MTVCLSPNGGTIYQSDAPSDRVHVATAEGVVTLGPGAAGPWTVMRQTLAGHHVGSLLLEPRRGGLFAGLHYAGGIHFSADDGQTWQPRAQGVSQEHIYTLAADDRRGDVILYAGTEPAHLFRSYDYGDAWEELPGLRSVPGTETWTFPAPPHIGHVKNMAFDPRHPRTVLVCIEQGALLKTTDDGLTWREVKGYYTPDDHIFYQDCHRIRLLPSNADVLFMAGGDGFYTSPDGGATWERLTTSTFRIGYPDHFFFSPADERVLFLAGARTYPGTWTETHTADACVMRSPDRGRTWERIGVGLREHLHGNIEALSLEVWPGGFGFFAGTTDGEVFRSQDRGASWTQIATGLPPISKVGHYRRLLAA